MWAHADLPDEELRDMASVLRTGTCGCRSPKESGTRHGYMCSPHRALDELRRRAARAIDFAR